MFGIGGTELLVILVIALIVLGPKSVPKIARTLGKAMSEFRRVSTDFQRTLNTEVALEEEEKRKKEAKAAAQKNAEGSSVSTGNPDTSAQKATDSPAKSAGENEKA